MNTGLIEETTDQLVGLIGRPALRLMSGTAPDHQIGADKFGELNPSSQGRDCIFIAMDHQCWALNSLRVLDGQITVEAVFVKTASSHQNFWRCLHSHLEEVL